MKFQEYLPVHEEIYPRPAKKKLTLGWAFWAAVSVAVAAIVLASLRTAHSFYTAAVLSAQIYSVDNPTVIGFLSFTEAAAAMLAIEGGIVYGAVKRSQQKGKVHPKIFQAYLGLLILISIVAGLGQSLGLIVGLPEGILAGFSWVLAIVLGVGASIVAWLSGEMLGVEMLKFEQLKSAADKSYAAGNVRWLNAARKEWYQVRNQAPEAALTDKDAHVRKVRAYLGRVVLRDGRVPPDGEIGKAVGLSEKYVAEIREKLKAEQR